MSTTKVLLTLALTATWLAFMPTTAAAQEATWENEPQLVEWGVVEFTTPTKVFDRILWGEYVLVHDRVWEEGGKPCTRIHERDNSKPGGVGDIVVAFYCDLRSGIVPTEQLAVFSKRTGATMGIMREMTRYQFAGRTEEHKVPAGAKAGRPH